MVTNTNEDCLPSRAPFNRYYWGVVGNLYIFAPPSSLNMDFLMTAWQSYPVLIDFVLYAFVFGAVARVSFAKAFPGHGGKTLAIAVGVFLAAGLAMAQRTLGFSVESMGPVAILILAAVVFITAYKFLRQSEMPLPMTIFISAMLVVVLLRATMPQYTARFLHNNPLTVSLIVAGLLYWVWHTSDGFANKLFRRMPGPVLAKDGAIPDEDTLAKERLFVKKRIRGVTRENENQEHHVRGEISKLLAILEREGITPNNRARLTALVNDALKRIDEVRQRTSNVFRMEEALRRFDFHWFNKTHGINLSALTPEQQEILRKNLLDERKQVMAEEEIARIETQIKKHVEQFQNCIAKARQDIQIGTAAGAIGWLMEAEKQQAPLKTLEDEALAWEKRLLRLVKQQHQDLLKKD